MFLFGCNFVKFFAVVNLTMPAKFASFRSKINQNQFYNINLNRL